MATTSSRVGIFGWGIVAPRSPDVDSFERNLESSESWLEAFNGFGPDNFLVGKPDFDLGRYRDWIRERFPPSRFRQIETKIGLPSQYAIGAFVQALEQNPGLEKELQRLGAQTHVYVGTGLGDLPTIYDLSIELFKDQNRWDRFWARPENNSHFRAYLENPSSPVDGDVPPDPAKVPEDDRRDAEDEWWHYWAGQSPELRQYLEELREIESAEVEGNVESGKMTAMRRKRLRNTELREKWGAPSPPWDGRSSAGILWNIHNIAASQVSMMGQITGLSYAPVSACATFGVALKLAMSAIRAGEAKAVVIGASDPPPHPLSVGAFYRARVIAADAAVSKPLTGMRGTHVSGGAAIWIVGDYEHMRKCGFEPLGLEPLGVGTSSDADHIITPSQEGPMQAMKEALQDADVHSGELTSWDMHATATPGDFLEMQNLRSIAPESILITARKGTFGHGMGVAGGWELTAQHLGLQKGKVFPTPLESSELNPEIAKLHDRFAFEDAVTLPSGVVGKLSMGIGGVNACVVSRPWGKTEKRQR